MKCVITGKKTISGNKISHSNRHVKRTFKANLRYYNLFSVLLQSYVRLCLSHNAMRTINKFYGIDECLLKYTNKNESMKIKQLRKKINIKYTLNKLNHN